MAEPRKHRILLQHAFEGGGQLHVDVLGDVSTRDVIWALKRLIEIKEREIGAVDPADDPKEASDG